ncbi:hypothetical protein BDA99DRAFT_561231 [Phascolomyces articulosus]|uniref:Uncharacterized protein n=1 Tax=Phascolomyces articulosus TaxID=60185 RepID=A0AAD5JXF5_9FUNG|nr:hypothetical protein BDA99DRAFT_561231 [Phascolomyces articulosus]
MMATNFNTEPIMLRHASSLVPKDDKMMLYQQPTTTTNTTTTSLNNNNNNNNTCFTTLEDDSTLDDMLIMDVPQNLEPEQVHYEFPPKAHLQALAQMYDTHPQDDDCSFFDESSFSTMTTTTGDFHSSRSSSPSDHYYANNDHLDQFFDSVLDQVVGKQHMIPHAPHEEEEEEDYLIEDGRLSPLELPEQEEQIRRDREQSYDSVATIKQVIAAPCSFLDSVREEKQWRPHHPDLYKNQYRPTSAIESEDLPVFCSESELLQGRPVSPYSITSSSSSSALTHDSQHVVLIKLSKKKKHMKKVAKSPSCSLLSPRSRGGDEKNKQRRCPSSQTNWSSDEGYDDNDHEDQEYCYKNNINTQELPIESASIFLPLSDQEQEHLIHNDILQSAAAVKIQAAWRGYQCRRRQQQEQQTSAIRPKHRLMVNMVRLCGQVHRQQMNRVQERLHSVEDHLQEETAMRIAFEKAMEDMTVLVDQQQKVLYDRLEQEINMRQVYERKMEQAMQQVPQLEQSIRKEAKQRNELESMMTRVLEQMHDMKREQKLQVDARKKLELQLSEAHVEIEKLKKQQHTVTAVRVKPATTTQQPKAGLTVHAGARSVAGSSTISSKSSSVLRRNTTLSTTSTTSKPTTQPRSISRASSRMSTASSSRRMDTKQTQQRLIPPSSRTSSSLSRKR